MKKIVAIVAAIIFAFVINLVVLSVLAAPLVDYVERSNALRDSETIVMIE